jgi:ABC-type multidrug transport system ATPase subunit
VQDLGPVRLHDVEARGVERWHGRTVALHATSLHWTAGQVVGLLGPNGAGKSTMLSLLSTLQRPSAGRLLWNAGRLDAVRDRTVLRPHIGVVAHDAMVWGELTGRENLRLQARLLGQDDPVARADRWLEWVGVARAGDRPVHAWSRGMRQRLALARALMGHPSLVLLDEPSTGLDRDGQRWLWEAVSALRATGRLVVVVTHELVGLPPGLLDRVMVLQAGRVVHEGPVEVADPAQVYEASLRGALA